ncbi:MAG: hypothetical protein EBR20_01270 [Bacteroidetes bacterium]|nr:hypothetical protein [Bacteroidota bacterium]
MFPPEDGVDVTDVLEYTTPIGVRQLEQRTHVSGGFGFFGSVNQYTHEWTLSPDITSLIGYTYPGKRTSTD